jgi:carbonic anhydrase
VIGIFIEACEKRKACPELINQLKVVIGKPAEKDAGGKVSADPTTFLPENLEEYYRYEGSLPRLNLRII